MESARSWNDHYTRDKAVLRYPDENLVRILKPYMEGCAEASIKALDIGCGTGRHISLLADLGVNFIVGTDISFNAIEVSKSICLSGKEAFVQCDNTGLPFGNYSFDLAVAWGSLHYSDKKHLPGALAEIRKVMKKGGLFAGTLRSDRDTHMKRGTHLGNNVWRTSLSDINGAVVSFFGEEELSALFESFSDFSYGLIERTPLGSKSVISHYYFRAMK